VGRCRRWHGHSAQCSRAEPCRETTNELEERLQALRRTHQSGPAAPDYVFCLHSPDCLEAVRDRMGWTRPQRRRRVQQGCRASRSVDCTISPAASLERYKLQRVAILRDDGRERRGHLEALPRASMHLSSRRSLHPDAIPIYRLNLRRLDPNTRQKFSKKSQR
jgi:hypothetical protein